MVPSTVVFDVHSAKIEKVGEFPGFYEHAIPGWLRDTDGDGNTEIIYVKDIFWPSGKPHSDIIAKYGVGKYRDGKYVNTDVEFVMSQNKK